MPSMPLKRMLTIVLTSSNLQQPLQQKIADEPSMISMARKRRGPTCAEKLGEGKTILTIGVRRVPDSRVYQVSAFSIAHAQVGI